MASAVKRPFAHAAPTAGPSGHDLAEGPTARQRLPETTPSADPPRHLRRLPRTAPGHGPEGRAWPPASRAPGRGLGHRPARRAGRPGPVRVRGLLQVPRRQRQPAPGPRHGGRQRAPPGRHRGQPAPCLRAERSLRSPGHRPRAATPAVPSLIAPLTASSMIYCSDCHASNDTRASGGSRAARPARLDLPEPAGAELRHAGRHAGEPRRLRPLLQVPQARDGALDALLLPAPPGPRLARPGRDAGHRHPHPLLGLPQRPRRLLAGRARQQNNAHLVDFDLNVVKALPGQAAPRYTASGGRGGSCALVCHGRTHDSLSY